MQMDVSSAVPASRTSAQSGSETSLQGGGIQLQVFCEDGKYVVKDWTKGWWISPDTAI